MPWYDQQDNPNTLLIACANLLKKLDYDLSPQKFHDLLISQGISDPDRNAITAAYPHIQISASGENSWPGYDNAIVTFQNVMSGSITHNHCAVLSSLKRTLIDSADGQEKDLSELGVPIAWTAYEIRETSPITAEDIEAKEDEPKSQFKPGAYKPGDAYIWCKGDNIWDVARMMGCKASRLMEYNDMESPDELEPGLTLHVPVQKTDNPQPVIRYELLPEPKPMHIAKVGGTKRWLFGHATTWDDIKTSGFYPQNRNVSIVAIAHVPIVGKDNTPETAAYYLDARALGDYATTGIVRYTIGYSWIDLADGHYQEPPPKKVAENKVIIQQQKEAEIAAAVQVEEDRNIIINPNLYKETWQPLTPPVVCVAVLPAGLDSVMVQEYDTRRPDRKLLCNQDITIAGTFEKDGVLYGRPTMATNNGYWYGIPMDYLISQDELYNTEVDLPTRVAMHGHLTWQERIIWVPTAKTLTQYTKFIRLWNTKNKQKET